MQKLLTFLIASHVFTTAISATVVFYPNGSYESAAKGYPGADTVLIEELPIDTTTSSPATNTSQNSPSGPGFTYCTSITISTDNPPTNTTNSTSIINPSAVESIHNWAAQSFYGTRTGHITPDFPHGQPIFPPITLDGVRIAQYLINPTPRIGPDTWWLELRGNLYVVLKRYRPDTPKEVRLERGGGWFATARRTNPDGDGTFVNEIMSLITVHAVGGQSGLSGSLRERPSSSSAATS